MIGELNRPPYEKGNAGAALYEHAKTLAAEIGFDLVDTFTGGGSDGNFTAPHTATLDGLGRRRQGRAYPLRADVHLLDRAAGTAAAPAVPDAAMTANPGEPDDRDAPPDDGAAAHAHGSFFGRRKGHKLRIHQADLIDNLLPRLALDISKPGTRPISPNLFDGRNRRCQARNRIWRRRTSDRGSAGLSAISGSSAASPMSTAWQRS